MAPRRPSNSKKRETRMHAALDAMSPYGFPNKLVRTTVNSLLKVYGGTDGWIFIEEGSYSLLIETLLEKNQADASAQDDLMDDKLGDGHNGASASGCSYVTLLPCSNTETSYDASPTNQVGDTVSASSQTDNQLPIKAVASVSATCETGNQLSIMALDSVSATNETGTRLSVKIEPTEAAASELCNELPIIKAVPLKIEPDAPAAASEPRNELPIIKAIDVVLADKEYDCKPAYSTPQTKALQPVERLGHQRRRPCFGWISDDDEEEEEELLDLPPAPLSVVVSMFAKDGGHLV